MSKPPLPVRNRDAIPLFAALEGVLSAIGGRSDDLFARVRLNWPRIVGPHLARISAPTDLSDGVLRVEVEGESWRRALLTEQRRLLGRLRALSPAIQRLHLVATTEVPRAEPPPATPAPAPPDPRNAGVADPALRRALDELAAVRRRQAGEES